MELESPFSDMTDDQLEERLEALRELPRSLGYVLLQQELMAQYIELQRRLLRVSDTNEAFTTQGALRALGDYAELVDEAVHGEGVRHRLMFAYKAELEDRRERELDAEG